MSLAITNAKFTGGISYDYSDGPSYRSLAGSYGHGLGLVALEIGSTAGKVNKEYPPQQLTIDSSTPVVLDLSSFTDATGNAVGLSEINAIIVELKSTTAGEDLTVGGGTSPVLATMPVLKALTRGSSSLQIVTPITVDSTHKNLRLAVAAGTSVSVWVTIVGH